ncbi:MAG TPA: ATP-binding protein [Pirellulales bacterium]|nr:ATP-binding protein [Pirellulales bacterium]
MQIPSPRTTFPRLRVRVAMNAAARENLIPLTAVLVPIYLVSGIFRARFFHTLNDTIVFAEFASAALTFVLLCLIMRFDLQGRWVHSTLVVVGLVAIVDSLIQLYHSHSPWDTTNLALIVGATGIVSLSIVASALLYVVTWTGWLGCMLLYPNGLWIHFGFFLLWTTGIAVAVQAARTKLLRRLFESESQQREELERLVTERTRQLADSREQLRHSERLASVGTLAAGIAHEINNPVGMMLLSAEQLLATSPAEEESVAHLAHDIINNAKRCGQIVKNVLRFAQHDSAEHRADDINAVVRSAVELVRSYAEQEGGLIRLELATDLPQVLLNRVELEQALVNLIRNGIEAASERPTQVTISTTSTGSRVRITVSDNGRGIETEYRARVFDPFFTTRQGGGGTGLGLSLVYGIVTDHGGTIRIESPSEGGTSMIVELPIVQSALDVVS